MITISVNGRSQHVNADPSTPLPYVLRDDRQLNGANFGCSLGQCERLAQGRRDNPVQSLREARAWK